MSSSGWLEPPTLVGEPAWLAERRAAAWGAFRARGLPTNHDEAWRFTPLGLLRDPAALLHRVTPSGPSIAEPLPRGVFVTRLSEALRAGAPAVERHFGRLRGADHAFAQLNTALFQDGAFIHVHASGRTTPLIELRCAAGGVEGTSYQRTLVVVDRHCSLTLIERHESNAPGIVNAALELVLEEDAVVEHLRVQSGPALHLGTVAVDQASGSRYGSRVFALGGPLARLDLSVALGGEGATCELDGLFALRGREHADLYTLVDHQRPHCTSLERYKGLLADEARGVFDGTILVEKGAAGTNARQESRNLLLSNTSIVNTKPHLEIDADDVKCGHGATVGHLDEQQLFYLTARGIDRETARAMLAFAFAQEIIQRAVASPDDKSVLRAAIIERIPGGARLEGAS